MSKVCFRAGSDLLLPIGAGTSTLSSLDAGDSGSALMAEETWSAVNGLDATGSSDECMTTRPPSLLLAMEGGMISNREKPNQCLERGPGGMKLTSFVKTCINSVAWPPKGREKG